MKKFGTYRCAAAAALALVLVTGCSSMKFLATGKEFQKICEDNGLQVQDTLESVKTAGSYVSLSDAYLATDAENAYTVCYVRFSDSRVITTVLPIRWTERYLPGRIIRPRWRP